MRPSDTNTPAQQACYMKHAFAQLRRRWCAAHPGARFEFLAVFEEHKSGWPHIHVISRVKWIDMSWLRSTWEKLTGSPEAWVESADRKGKVASYLCKYMGKSLVKFQGCQRFWTSRGWNDAEHQEPEPPPCISDRWLRYNVHLDVIEATIAHVAGWHERRPHKLAWAEAPP